MAAVRNPSAPLRAFALQQARTLLRRLAYQVNRASRPGRPEVTDDLQAAIGRFSRCLRLFGEFLPDGKSKRVRREIKELMDLTATVHDCDTVLDLVGKANMPPGSAVIVTLTRERKEAVNKLRAEARRLGRSGFSQKWRIGLRL